MFLFLGILLLSVFDSQAKTPGNFAPSLVADFTANTTVICAGDSIQFTDLTTENPTGWTWTFDGGDTVTSLQQNPVVVYNTPGNYTVHLKSNNGEEGDEKIQVDFIKVMITPSSTFNVTSASSQCAAGNSFSFANTGSSGTHFWGFAGASPINSTAVNPGGIVFTGAGTHSVSHKVTDDGCSSTTIVDITLFGNPTALVVTTTASNCASPTGTLTIGATTGGTGPFTYSVNGSNFTSTTSYPGRPPGTYTVTVKDANGCTFTRTAVVSSSGGPTSVAVQITSSTCGNANGIINLGTVTGGVAPYLFTIDNGTLSTTTTYTGITSGPHTVKVKDANNCQLSQQILVTNTVPSAVATTTTQTSCVASNGTLTLGAVTGGRSPFTYSVDGGSFSSTTNYTGLAAGTHTLVVKDVTGCSFTTTITITTTPGPTLLNSSSTFSKCSSPTGSITVQTPVGGTAPFTYSFNGGTFSSTQTFTALAAGTYTVVAKDANGCTISQNITVSNTPPPTALSVTTGPSACAASTGTISIGSVTGGTAPYSFSVNGGAFSGTNNYTGFAPGTYPVVVRDFNGCTFTTSATVTGTQPTAAVITTTPTSCFYSTGTITIGAITGGVSPFVYSVNGSSFTATTTYTGRPAGTYTVSVKDFNSCILTQTVIITSSQPTALAVTTTTTPCGASSGTATIGAATGGASPFTYSFNGSAFSTTTNYTGLAAGVYTVIVKDANACTFTTSVTVLSDSGPTALVVTNTGTTCNSNNGTISIGAVTGGVAPFVYSVDNGPFSAITGYSNIFSGNHSVRVRDAAGCIFTVVTTLSSTPGPTDVVLTSTNATCGNVNGTITIGAVTGGTPPFTYSLDGGAFTTTTSYTGLNAANHQVTVKDANNCTFVKSVTIISSSGPTAINFTFRHSCGSATNNGFISISGIVGGTAPYTYSFNGGPFTSTLSSNGLGAGTYTITVKDVNGCTFSTTHTILTVAGFPSGFTSSEVDPGCGQSNGSVVITSVTGGTPPYLYKLGVGSSFTTSNTFTGLVAGSYPLNIRDANGCETGFGGHPILSIPGGPSAVAISVTNSTCNQPNGTLTATSVTGGVPPYQYSLNGGAFQSGTTFTGLASGTSFPLVVSDANGCTFTQHRGLNNTGTGVSTPIISQSGFLLTSNHSTGNQWFFNGVAIAGSTGQTHFAQFNGSYTVVVSTASCTSAVSTPVVITNQSQRLSGGGDAGTATSNETSEVRDGEAEQTVLAIPESTGTAMLNAYPNPNDGVFTISFQADVKITYTVEVFNVFGQVVFAEQISEFEGTYVKELHLEEFGAGIYTVVLTSPEERTVQKVVTY